MGDNPQIIEIIVFGLVAAFLLFRLRSVLGRRTGSERQRDFRTFRAPPDQGSASSAPVIDATATPVSDAAPAVDKAAIKAAYRDFDEAKFLLGARGAFQIIVNAFAAGDTTALRALLSNDVYQTFAKAIADRQAARETQETKLVSIKGCEIATAELSGNEARVGVRFVSDQINVTRSADGAVLDGEPDHAVEKIDIWTFARDVRSPDPNWKLAGTKSA